jgi:hypothetical protein
LHEDEEDSAHAEELEERRELADHARADLDLLPGQEEEQDVTAQADDVPGQDDRQHPSGDLTRSVSLIKQAQDEPLVGEGVEVGAELRPRIRHPRDAAVEAVGDSGGDEEDERELEAMIVEGDQDCRDGGDPEQRESVRNVQHDFASAFRI